MPIGYQAGSAYVPVTPTLAGFQATIGAAMEAAGNDAGKDFASSWERSAKPRLEAALAAMPDVDIRADSTDLERKVAGVRAELESLRDARIGIDIDEDGAQERLGALMATMAELQAEPDIKIAADADVAKAMAELQALSVEVGRVDRDDVDIKVKANTRPAISQVSALEGALMSLGESVSSISPMLVAKIGLIAAGIVALIPVAAAATAAIQGISMAAAGIGAGIGVLALGLAPVIKAAAASNKSAGGGGADAAEQNARRIADAERGVTQAREQAARAAEEAAARVSDAQRGVREASEAAAQAQADSAERVKDAQRAVADAAAAAARANRDAARRVVEAQAAVREAASAAAQANRSAAEQVKAAQQAVSDAHEQAAARVRQAQETYRRAVEAAARADEQAARRVEQAQEALRRTREQATRAVAAAARQQRDAELALAEAQRRVVDAQERVTQARRDAKRAMDDLNDAVRGGALDERAAVQRLEEAKEALKNLGPSMLELARARHELADAERASQMDPTAENRLAEQAARERLKALEASVGGTKAEREAAQLAYDQAVFNLEQIKKKNAELAEEKKKADRAGVDGSQKVRDAVSGVKDAQQGVIDAQQRERDAARAAADARVDAARSVRDAERALEDAARERTQQRIDGARRVADAERSIASARRDGARQIAAAERALGDARERQQRTYEEGVRRVAHAEQAVAAAREQQQQTQADGARSIADAQRSLQRAYQDQQRTGVDSARRVAEAQRELENAQRDQQRTGVDSARRVAEAQRRLAEAHQDAARKMGAAGGGANAYRDALAKLTPEGRSFLGLVQQMKGGLDVLSRTAQRTMLPGLERALRSLAPAFPVVNTLVGRLGATLGKLAEDGAKSLRGPFWTEFGKWLSERLPAWLDTGGRIIGNFLTVLAAVFKALAPAGEDFLTMLKGWSEALAGNSKTLEKNPQFKEFLAYCRGSLPLVAKTLGDVGRAILDVVKALAPYGPLLLVAIGATARFISACTKLAVNTAPAVLLFAGLVKMAVSEVARRFELFRTVVGAVAGAVVSRTRAMVAGVVAGYLNMRARISDTINRIRGVVTSGFSRVGSIISGGVRGWVSRVADGGRAMVSAISRNVGAWPGVVMRAASRVGSAISGAVRGWVGSLRGFDVGSVFRRAWSSAATAVSSAVSSISRAISSLFAPIQRLTSSLSSIRMPSIRIPGFAAGGLIPGFASGGLIPGQAPRDGRDNLLANVGGGTVSVMSGEFVQPVASVEYYGAGIMEALRRKLIPREAFTPRAAALSPAMPAGQFASGGLVGVPRATISPALSRSGGGATVAVLAADDAAMLADLASRPTVTKIDGRQLFTTMVETNRRYGGR